MHLQQLKGMQWSKRICEKGTINFVNETYRKGFNFLFAYNEKRCVKTSFFSYIPFESLGFPVNIKQQEKRIMIIKNNCKKSTKNSV